MSSTLITRSTNTPHVLTQINFYQLTAKTPAKAIPYLAERIINQNEKLLMVFDGDQALHEMDISIWTFASLKFIPHGTYNDGHIARQPIYLTNKEENPISAKNLFFTYQVTDDFIKDFDKAIYMFDGDDKDELSKAKDLYKFYCDNHILNCWQQNEDNSWKKVDSL